MLNLSCVNEFYYFYPGLGGGVLLGILGGGGLPGSPNPERISDQKCNFPHPFSDKTSKIHTHFQTWPLGKKLLSSLLRSEHKQKKNIQIHFQFPYFSIWNWNDKYVHTLSSSLENHTWFQTKMGKVCTRFQTKTVQKPYSIGRHIPIWLIYGSTHTPKALHIALFWNRG